MSTTCVFHADGTSVCSYAHQHPGALAFALVAVLLLAIMFGPLLALRFGGDA